MRKSRGAEDGRSAGGAFCPILTFYPLWGRYVWTISHQGEKKVNSRPLTVEYLNDPSNPTPLAPIQHLTFKSDVVFLPPGEFQRNDIYCRKYYRPAQHLANEFWSRWRVEFLSTLQARQKWVGKCKNLSTGDIVLIKDSDIFMRRNGWPMARVEEIFPSVDDLVRKVPLKVAHKQSRKSSVLVRPVTKLVLLVEGDNTQLCLRCAVDDSWI